MFPRRKAPDNLQPPAHWGADAVCRREGTPPDVFFPSSTDLVGIEQAKSVCRRCPVELRCRSEALNRGEEFGVWGGLTEEERRAVRRRDRAAAQERDAEALAPAS
ncbi:WhiB family transcriptional regulator [Streptomyces sp. NBC_01420]